MENIVFSAKVFNGYYVNYPYGSHIDFIATSYKALKDGLKANQWPYKPIIYRIDTFGKPKFSKLNTMQLKALMDELKMK